MGKRDKQFDAYIAKSPEFARPILSHLREVVHSACPEVEETIKWGHLFFMYQGMLCFMASFKSHCGFGFWKGSLIVGKAGGVRRKGDGPVRADHGRVGPSFEARPRRLRQGGDAIEGRRAEGDSPEAGTKAVAASRPGRSGCRAGEEPEGPDQFRGLCPKPSPGVHRVDHRGKAPGNQEPQVGHGGGVACRGEIEELEVREAVSRPDRAAIRGQIG